VLHEIILDAVDAPVYGWLNTSASIISADLADSLLPLWQAECSAVRTTTQLHT
jgi:hypothetical protein